MPTTSASSKSKVPERGLRSTRSWALAALVAVAALGVEPFFLRALWIDAELSAKQYDALPYRRIPGLREACEDVRHVVPRGTSIAFHAPYTGWWEGYSFSYMRAAYLLSEYRLVPLVDSNDRPRPEVLEEVEWVLAYGADAAFDGFERVQGAGDVSLLRKAR